MVELSLPGLADLQRAARRIAGVAVKTPLVESRFLNETLGYRVLLKCETLQRTGSFKFRGAYNALTALDAADRRRGVVAVSSGNHGQGVAEAARLLEVPATIVMPDDAPASKRARTLRSGATIIDYDRATEDRNAVAAGIIESTGVTLIHPFDNPDVIAGQGTVGLEITEQAGRRDADVSIVVVPCGGGGLSAGVGLAIRPLFPDCAIRLVEPEGFDDYRRSLAAGQCLSNPTTFGSVCDALMAEAPGPRGFVINRAHHAEAVTVSDQAVLDAVAFAARELKLVVEPGGAAGLAALLEGKINCRGGTVVVVLSGANIDDSLLANVLTRNWPRLQPHSAAVGGWTRLLS